VPDNEAKRFWARSERAIGAYAASMLDPIARARGFATTALLTEWPSIVGAELASFTLPDKVIWPRRTDDGDAPPPQSAWRADGAILVLRVEGPRAIELQHRSDQILERLNVYFGYRAIAQLRFLQAPISRVKQAPVAAVPACEPDEASIPAAISDSFLRQALARLGASLRLRLRQATPGSS
jgi:hypothetical protein